MIKQLFHIPLEDIGFWLWMLLAGIFLISFLIQNIYFFKFYSKLPSYKKLNYKTVTDPVSVIICAKNEAENLRRILPSIINQFYPKFEIIVVNDGSTDDTDEILAEFRNIYPNFYFTGIEGKPGNVSGKKVALTLGIKAAHYDQLVFTEADSEPLSPHWLRHMQSNFMQKTDIVLGYGGYKTMKGLLNKWIRTDTVYIAMQYLSFALKGIPYMGVGRNLAYRRSLFFANKGFASHLHIAPGDDELFINETSNRYNTSIEIDPDSFTLSEPKKTWKNWIRHKRRHYSASLKYKKSHKRLLSTEIISRLLFFTSGIILLSFWKMVAYVAIILLIREISFIILFKLVMKRLKERNILLLSLIYDIVWPVFAGFLLVRNKFATKTPKWK